jgi:hypothetical protein
MGKLLEGSNLKNYPQIELHTMVNVNEVAIFKTILK